MDLFEGLAGTASKYSKLLEGFALSKNTMSSMVEFEKDLMIDDAIHEH